MFVLLLALPGVFNNGYVLQVLSLGWLYAVLSMGVVISYGLTGVPNMSQGTLFGIGAYCAANLMYHFGIPFVASLLIAGCAGAVSGGLLGATTLRVKGNYWWLITIAFTQVLYIVFNSWTPVTGGVAGFVNTPVASVGGLQIDSDTAYYYLALLVLGMTYALYARLQGSRFGRAAVAVGVDELTARGLGISPGPVKIAALAAAGLGAGLAGACLPAITGYIDAGSFNLTFSFSTMLFAIVGGLRSLKGSVLAAASLTFLINEVSVLVNYQLLIFGGVVLAVLLWRGTVAPSVVRRWGSATTPFRGERGAGLRRTLRRVQHRDRGDGEC